MGSRTNIGIYIAPTDKDIAAWFNLLERNGQSRSRWVRGLLAAYALDKPLRIGVIDKRLPLIRSGEKKGDTVEVSGPFSYGWHVRGPNREFVIGSVVNISIRNDEIKPILEESWQNGHKLASFIKALIRKNLKTGDRDIPPKVDDLNQMWSEYLVKNNVVKTKRKRARELERPEPMPTPMPAPEPVDDWVTAPREAPPEKEPEKSFVFKDPPPPKQAEQSFTFEEPEPVRPSTPHPGLAKNPLIDQI